MVEEISWILASLIQVVQLPLADPRVLAVQVVHPAEQRTQVIPFGSSMYPVLHVHKLPTILRSTH